MPTTYADLLARARDTTRRVSLDALRLRLAAREELILVDVREAEEVRAGFIPGARSIPRSVLESRVEAELPDRSAAVVVYCAGGARSALAARTLADLGYTGVETADPGFTRWKELGYPVETPGGLTAPQRDRYARHLLLREVGEAGQAKLLRSRVLLLGAGGLGSPAALYLAAAGVGTLGLVDLDTVDASNLQRQILHATSRVGVPKVESAARALADLNPDVRVVPHRERLTTGNVERLFADYDVIVDGTDNFPTRYLVSDAGVFLGKPIVHGSVFRFDGQATTFVSARAAATLGIAAGPCYRCLYPAPPDAQVAPGCQEAGVLGVLPGLIGVVQATEALKLLLGVGAPLVGRLLAYDSLAMKLREFKLPRDPACPACGDRPTLTAYPDYDLLCGRR